MTNTPDHMDGILAQWRRERPDLDVSPIGLLGRLFRSAYLADESLAEGIAPHGLQPGWFDLLAALRRSGRPYELNPTRLMETTMLSSGGMTKRLDRLDEAGLVERNPARRPTRHPRPADPVRRTVIDKAVETHARNEERLLASLTQADRRALDGLLREVPHRTGTARDPRVRRIPVGPVAQPGLEQGAFNPRVAGSNPARPTRTEGCH